MALATIATLATIAAAGTSMYAGYEASRQKIPTTDAASSSKKVSDAQALALPEQLKLQQLMQQGGKGTINMPAHTRTEKVYNIPAGSEWDPSASNNLSSMAVKGIDPIAGTLMDDGLMSGLGLKSKRTVWKLVPASEWDEGGSMAGQPRPPEEWSGTQDIQVPAGPQEVDFSGFGTADIEGTKARQAADLQLSLSQKYGKQFAEEARKAAEQADPLGTQARKLEYELINKDMPVSAIPGTLDRQITDQVKAGRGLDTMSRDLLDQAIADANASRGGRTAAGDVAGSMATGAEGQARLNAALTKGGAFQSSGVTPEDVRFKRAQQKISNLGSFVNGATPQSQFGNLGNAATGATPTAQAQPSATLPNNASQIGSAYANSVNSTNTSIANNQSNNWFAGLSTLLNSVSALKTAKG